MKKLSLFLMTILCIGFVYHPEMIKAEETGEVTEQYTVTFDSNGGSAVASQTIDKDKTVARPSDPTRTGYTFKEWQLSGKTYDFNTKVEGNIILIAAWEEVKETPNSSYLASLRIDNLDLDQDFARTNENYTITVPADTVSVTIIATPDENSQILKGTGKVDLKDGKNVVQVITKLKETNDKEKTYTITITREIPDVTLESLKITGYALREAFEKDTYEYTVEVPYEVQEINVVAKASSSNASVSVTGGKDLVVGENTVVVSVTYSTGTKQEYSIKVTRLEENEEPTPVQSQSVTSSITSPTDTSSSNDNDSMKYIFIIVGCVIILLLAGLGIFFYLKSETPEKKMARLEKKKQKALAKAAKTKKAIKEVEETEEERVEEIEEVESELEQTKEAPTIDHSDILDGIDELFDEDEK